MAKLKAHGSILAEIKSPNNPGVKYRLMSDGFVLVNYAYRWQVHGKAVVGVVRGRDMTETKEAAAIEKFRRVYGQL